MSELVSQVLRAAQHTFVGHIGADPEIKYLDGGMSVAKARLAVNYKKDVDPDWFSLEAWNDRAQELADGVKKGDLVEVIGRIKSNTYIKKTGEKVTEVIITVQEFQVLDRKQPQQSAPPADKEDDDEIPF